MEYFDRDQYTAVALPNPYLPPQPDLQICSLNRQQCLNEAEFTSNLSGVGVIMKGITPQLLRRAPLPLKASTPYGTLATSYGRHTIIAHMHE